MSTLASLTGLPGSEDNGTYRGFRFLLCSTVNRLWWKSMNDHVSRIPSDFRISVSRVQSRKRPQPDRRGIRSAASIIEGQDTSWFLLFRQELEPGKWVREPQCRKSKKTKRMRETSKMKFLRRNRLRRNSLGTRL